MSLLTMLGLGALAFAALGMLLVAVSDLRENDSRGELWQPDFDPYRAESRAYLIDRRAA